MINVLHLYYDLLNLYGENANTRCLVHTLELNNITLKKYETKNNGIINIKNANLSLVDSSYTPYPQVLGLFLW